MKLHSRLSLLVSVTLVAGYFIVHAAYTPLVSSDADSGKALTSTLMKAVMDNITDLNARVGILTSSVGGGPAGEATSPSTSAPTGGMTNVANYTVQNSIGGGFNATTGVFQPTVAGRYLITANGYSGTSPAWILSICRNASCNRGGGAVAVNGNGSIADISKVINLNGTTDYATIQIGNFNGSTASVADVNITWTKLP